MGIGLPVAKFLDISPSPPAPLPGGEGREPANPLPSQREMSLEPDLPGFSSLWSCVQIWYKSPHVQKLLIMAHTRKEPERTAAPLSAPGETLGANHRSRRVRVDAGGRVVVPAGFRKALGIRNGEELLMSLDEGFVRLQTIDAALERVREIARRRRRGRASVVDAFIAERRAEASGE